MAVLKQIFSYLHATQYFEFLVYSRDWSKQRDAILEVFATEGSSRPGMVKWSRQRIDNKPNRHVAKDSHWSDGRSSQQSCCIRHCNIRRCTRDLLYAMPLWLQTDAQATCWQCRGDKELARLRLFIMFLESYATICSII